DSKGMVTGGLRPYAMEVRAKGDVAVVVNQGGNAGDIDTINVIDLKGKAPRIVRTLDVGQIVEDLAFSNDGNYVAVTAQDGSARPPSHPFYNDNGLVVVFSVNGTNLTKVAEARVGKWNQGVVWSGDGKTLLAQNMAENALSILSFDGKNLGVIGEIKVKGGPPGLGSGGRADRGALRRSNELMTAAGLVSTLERGAMRRRDFITLLGGAAIEYRWAEN